MRIHSKAAELASLDFDETLERVFETQRFVYRVEEILQSALAVKGVTDKEVQSSFHRYTAEAPTRDAVAEISSLLARNSILATIKPAPIREVLYQDQIFRKIWGAGRTVCPEADEQVKSRVWIDFDDSEKLMLETKYLSPSDSLKVAQQTLQVTKL